MPIIDTLILLGLPASGKSEVFRFLAGMDPQERMDRYNIGRPVHIDDFPYVHFMRETDRRLIHRGRQPLFFIGHNRPFGDPIAWLVLIHLINEEYENIRQGRMFAKERGSFPVLDLFERTVDAYRRFGTLAPDMKDPSLNIIAGQLADEIARYWQAVNEKVERGLDGATVIVEFSRGGPHGSPMPIIPPRGYASSLKELSPNVLTRAGIVYVEVDPAEARRKNRVRGLPNEEGSILHHSVPDEVMFGDYGCDDIRSIATQHTRGLSGTLYSATVERIVEEGGRSRAFTACLPVGFLDNSADLTSFVRDDPNTWSDHHVARLRTALDAAVQMCLAASTAGLAQKIHRT